MTVKDSADGRRSASRSPDAAGSTRRPRAGYHHGDLRAALIVAAEAELADNGVDGFTLRGCARRAGVSHAAPAHHFRDVRALLTELAMIGFERLSATMAKQAEGIEPGSVDYVVAIGLGYVTFAERYPHFFGLIFRTASLDRENPGFTAAAQEAFRYPVRAIGALYGSPDPMSDPELAGIVIGIWSMVHGFSTLLLAGQFDRHVAGGRTAIIGKLVPPLLLRYFAADRPAESKSRRASRRRSQSR